MSIHPNPYNPAQPDKGVPKRSDTLIYAYEARFARWLKGCFPEIELATYASDFSMFESMSDITYYPAFYYSRDSSDHLYQKIFTVYDEDLRKNIQFCPFLQSYTGRIYFRTQAEVFEAYRKLRFYWAPNSYLVCPWNGTDEVSVALRPLSMQVQSTREANDNKGAARYLEFKWRSQLFLQDTPSTEVTLTESISIHLFANRTVLTLDENPDLQIEV